MHYLRLFRQYNITHNKQKLKESKNSEILEMKIFSKVDVIHVVGNYEYQILKEKFNKKIIRNNPIYIYDNSLSNVEKDFSKRKDLKATYTISIYLCTVFCKKSEFKHVISCYIYW